MIYMKRLVTGFLILTGIWAGGVQSACGDKSVPEMPEIPGSARWVGCHGFIMLIGRSQDYLILKEKQIVVGKFIVGNEVLNTRLENSTGGNVGLDHFSVGQWVAIRGYEVSPAKIYACSVQAIKGYLPKDMRKIVLYEKLRPR